MSVVWLLRRRIFWMHLTKLFLKLSMACDRRQIALAVRIEHEDSLR